MRKTIDILFHVPNAPRLDIAEKDIIEYATLHKIGNEEAERIMTKEFLQTQFKQEQIPLETLLDAVSYLVDQL